VTVSKLRDSLTESQQDLAKVQRESKLLQNLVTKLQNTEQGLKDKVNELEDMNKLLQSRIDLFTQKLDEQGLKTEDLVMERVQLSIPREASTCSPTGPMVAPTEAKKVKNDLRAADLKLLSVQTAFDLLQAEKEEVESLLAATQERCERLQDESMQSILISSHKGPKFRESCSQTKSYVEVCAQTENVTQTKPTYAVGTFIPEGNESVESLVTSDVLSADSGEDDETSISQDMSNWPHTSFGKALETSSASRSILSSSISISSFNSTAPQLNQINPTSTKDAASLDDIECLTYTMLGSWFQKYNRHGKNPKMRFFWINPYTRTLIYAHKPGSSAQKSFLLNSIQWTDAPTGVRNFFPSMNHCITLNTSSRDLKLVPISWHDHDVWVKGVSTLLQRSYSNPQELADGHDDTNTPRVRTMSIFGTPKKEGWSRVQTVGVEDGTPSLHRRLFTISKRASTPNTLGRPHMSPTKRQ
jgi:Meiotic cell cortex C-terminal pleckstrin homology